MKTAVTDTTIKTALFEIDYETILNAGIPGLFLYFERSPHRLAQAISIQSPSQTLQTDMARRVCCWLVLLSTVFFTSEVVLSEEQPKTSLSEAACNFSIELLKAASEKDDENVLVSPISISMILSMLQQGARDKTAEQLQNVLHMSPEVSKEGYSTVISNLKDERKKVTLEWGNGIYLSDGFTLEEDFKDVVSGSFQSKIEQLDFSLPEDVSAKINNWIGEVTHGEIVNLTHPSVITKETLMILVNGIYFKGIWSSKFDKARTKLDIFKSNENETTNTFFLRQEDRFRAGEDSSLGLKWLELPYEDEQFSMLLILPDSEQGLQEVIDNITGADLQRLISNTDTRHVLVTIPKFKLSWKSSLQIPLEKLGLTDLFSENANLGGISSTHKSLRVSQMIHQANIEVDEDGTTAAAATYIFGIPLSAIIYRDEMEFYADHPFLVFIIDKKNKIPLFAAKISHPTYE